MLGAPISTIHVWASSLYTKNQWISGWHMTFFWTTELFRHLWGWENGIHHFWSRRWYLFVDFKYYRGHSGSKYLKIQRLSNDKLCKLCISIRSFSIIWGISVTVHFCSQIFLIRMYSDAYGMFGKVLIIIVMLKSNLAQFCAIYGYRSNFFRNTPPFFRYSSVNATNAANYLEKRR